MKSNYSLWLGVALLFAASGSAVAGFSSQGWFIERYDQNDDAKVTAEEFEQARRSRYDLTDEDGNGLVNVDEYVQEYANRLDKKIEDERKAHIEQTHRRFGALDKNDNQQIEWQEYEASGEYSFKRFDTDENGVINADDPRPKHRKHKHKHGKDGEKAAKSKDGKEHYHKHKDGMAKKHKAMHKKHARRTIRMPTTHRKKGMMYKYDTDDDGAITHGEFIAKRRADFDRTDSNRDSSLNADEYVAEFSNRLDAKIEKTRGKELKQAKVRFGVLDHNENGEMTFEEYQRSGHKRFARLDTNEDGVISKSDPRPKHCHGHKGHHKHGHGHKDHHGHKKDHADMKGNKEKCEMHARKSDKKSGY